jgi:hypothetical protein
MKKNEWFICFGISLLSGCASIVNGTHQRLTIVTAPVTDAHCLLTNDKGRWFVGKTPASVVVRRSSNNLLISCEKKKGVKGCISIKPEAKGMVLGNAFFGGVVGAGVDVASGAAFDYPQTIIVPLWDKKID